MSREGLQKARYEPPNVLYRERQQRLARAASEHHVTHHEGKVGRRKHRGQKVNENIKTKRVLRQLNAQIKLLQYPPPRSLVDTDFDKVDGELTVKDR